MASVRSAGLKALLNKKLSIHFQTTRLYNISNFSSTPEAKTGGGQRSSSAARGSVTAEGALAISIFIIAIASLLSLFGILQDQSVNFCRLDMAAEAVAGAQYLTDGSKAGELLSGIDIDLLGSAVHTDDGDVLIRLTYPEKAAFTPWDTGNFLITLQACRRAWKGRQPPEEETGDNEIYVYVAENGSVYHSACTCTYLSPHISAAPEAAVGSLRNRSGAKYYPCEYCGGGGGTIYITPDGNRYHGDRECSRLKRTYTKIRLSETSLPPCSKCGGQ